MKKNSVKNLKNTADTRFWAVTVAVLGVILIALTVLLILEANGVFYQDSENGASITPPERANSEMLSEGDYRYVLLTDGTVMITAYMGRGEENVVVPSEVGGYQVSAIGEAAYGGLTVSNAKTVTVSEGITYIGTNVFLGAENAVLYLPSTLKQVDDNATYGFEDPIAIYFAGTREQWNTVRIGSGNKELVIVTCKGE